MFTRRMARTLSRGPRIGLARDCVVPAAVSAVVALAVPTAWTLLFGSGSYVGVQDDAVSTAAAEQFRPFLGEVLVAIAKVALSELVLLFVVILGLSLLWGIEGRRTSERRRWAIHLLGALVVAGVYFLFVADRHPGLFLSTLSRSMLAYPLLALARFLGPLIALASAVGYVIAVVKGPNRLRVAVGLATALVLFGLYARRQAGKRYVHEAYLPSPPIAGTDAAAEQKEKEKKKAAAAKQPPNRPNVLWLSVDSLRPDKIDGEHTPNIAKLLGESVYFPSSLVVVPRTGPSWCASLTSLSPLTNGVETMFPDSLAGRLATIGLPAHLAAKGYRTSVISDYAGEFFGKVDLGFQLRSIPEVELQQISGQLLLGNAPLVLAHAGVIYSAGSFERSLLPAPLPNLIRGLTSFTQPRALAEDLEAWLAAENASFFSLVFYSQPHFPYASNLPYYRKYHVDGASPSIAFGRDVANETPITSNADVAQIDALYRGALAESDAAIGRLVDRLQASGRLDDTILILTADHGEGLYDCPTCVGHGDNLDTMVTLRTPLAFRLPKKRYPKAAPAVVDTPVSQLDIYPTILALLGEAPIAVHEGLALLGRDGSLKPPPPARVHFAETGEWLWTTPAVPRDRLDYPPITGMATLEKGKIVIDRKYLPVIRAAKHRAAIRWPWKLLYAPRKKSVDYRLFKVDEDPLEQKDLATSEPAIFEELKNALRTDVLRHGDMMSVRDYFVSRPPPPEEE